MNIKCRTCDRLCIVEVVGGPWPVVGEGLSFACAWSHVVFQLRLIPRERLCSYPWLQGLLRSIEYETIAARR